MRAVLKLVRISYPRAENSGLTDTDIISVLFLMQCDVGADFEPTVFTGPGGTNAKHKLKVKWKEKWWVEKDCKDRKVKELWSL